MGLFSKVFGSPKYNGEPAIQEWQQISAVRLPDDILAMVNAIYLYPEDINRITYYDNRLDTRFRLMDFQMLDPLRENSRTNDWDRLHFHPAASAGFMIGAKKFSGLEIFKKNNFLPLARCTNEDYADYLCYTSNPLQPLVYILNMNRLEIPSFKNLNEVIDVNGICENIRNNNKTAIEVYKFHRLDNMLKGTYAHHDFDVEVPELEMGYTKLLKGMSKLSNGCLNFSDISLSDEFETFSVRWNSNLWVMELGFNLNGSTHKVQVDPSSDLIDLGVIPLINNIITSVCKEQFTILSGEITRNEKERLVFCDPLTLEKLRNNGYCKF